MTKKFIWAFLLACIVLVVHDGLFVNRTISSSSGAPAGRTGNPLDNNGRTCNDAGCHSGNPVLPVTGWITWDGPADSSYIPGTVYTITCTATKTGVMKFGFEAAVFNLTGGMAGTIAATNSAQTQIITLGNKKYITHKSAGTSGTNTKSWSFSWTAPPAGTGDVTIHAAFNATNSNGQNTGDQIYTSVLLLHEGSGSTALHEGSNESAGHPKIFPTPVRDDFYVSFSSGQSKPLSIEVFDEAGRRSALLFSGMITAGDQSLRFSRNTLPGEPGVYFIRTTLGNRAYISKVLVL